MAWKGDSRRHSLARKGIKTAKGYAIKGETIIEVDYNGFTLEEAKKRLAEVKAENKAFWTPERLKAKKEMDKAIEKEKAKHILEFKSEVIRENSFGIVDDYGMTNNRMTLHDSIGDRMWIDWEVMGDDGNIIDYVDIGIWTVGKRVVDYDGVFELPKQAITLLKRNGYNTKEVEFE